MELISVRTNTRFIVDYDTHHLVPQIEVIILCSKKKYALKKQGIAQDIEITEMRFETSLKGVNTLIGELQATVQGLNAFDQLAGSINAMIKSTAPAEKK